MLGTLLSTVPSSQWPLPFSSTQHLLDTLDGVGFAGGLVVPVAPDPSEPERHTAGVAGRDLDAVERDLDDLFRLDVNDVALASGPLADLELQEALRLPLEKGVGEPLEGLAHHDPLTVGSTRGEVKVGQPTLTAPVAPFHCDDHEVE